MDSIEQTFESIHAMEPVKEQIMKNDAACPMHAQRVALDAADELALPLHKRMVAQYATNVDGNKELRLFYGDKEISFDEPDLFAFGEAIGKQSRFIAGTATMWGDGYEWPRVKGLLEPLITEGVLQYADELEDDGALRVDGTRPSPLLPATATAPRTWFESEDITTQIAGRALEAGYLELVVPIFSRCAYVDGRGRPPGGRGECVSARAAARHPDALAHLHIRGHSPPGRPADERDGVEEHACALGTNDGRAAQDTRGLPRAFSVCAQRLDRG